MPLNTTTRMLAPFLDRMTHEELDAIPYGIIQLDAHGIVRSYNRAERNNVGVDMFPLGRDFFLDVCPSANVPELWGRFRRALAEERLDETFQYTFSCGPMPRRVQLRMYWSARTRSVWLFVAKPDGSPLERVLTPDMLPAAG